MEFLYFVLAAYGLTQILVYGNIFNKVRPTEGWFGELLSCPICTCFCVGALFFGINGWTELFTYEYNLVNLLILGWLSSGTSYVFNMVFSDKGIQIGVNNG